MSPDTPSGVTRYKLDRNCGPCADGPWVAYSDHEPVERERAALKAENERLRNEMENAAIDIEEYAHNPPLDASETGRLDDIAASLRAALSEKGET